jgi:predicted RNase H-like HicB family nuclease
MMELELTAVYREVPEGGYIAWVQEIPGALTQGETLEEARENLRDAMQLLFEVRREMDDAEYADLPGVRERFLLTMQDGPLVLQDQH